MEGVCQYECDECYNEEEYCKCLVAVDECSEDCDTVESEKGVLAGCCVVHGVLSS